MKDLNGNQIKIDFTQPPRPAATPPYQGGELTNEEMHILRMLQRGKENSVKEKALASATGLQGVEVREKIRHLIMEHGVLIASCGRGFFIAVTEKEILEATRSLRHRAICILCRASKLLKLSVEDVFGQSVLEFKDEIK